VFRGAAKVATTRALAVRVTALKPATVYTFSVAARDSAGNVSPRSPGIVVRTCKATRKRC
jgi:chitodextrinase